MVNTANGSPGLPGPITSNIRITPTGASRCQVRSTDYLTVPCPHEIFRLGHRLAARFRLEADDNESVWSELRAEVAAARELAGRTRFATPEPVAIGAPSRDYSMPWLVQTWLDGTVAMDDDPGSNKLCAADLRADRQVGARYRVGNGPSCAQSTCSGQ